MVPSHQHHSALLPRLLSLKDSSRFILITDSIAQSADYLLLELYHRLPTDADLTLLSYETLSNHKRINRIIDCHKKSPSDVTRELQPIIEKSPSTFLPLVASGGRALPGPVVPRFARNFANSGIEAVVIVDTLAYIPESTLVQFLTALIRPNVCLIAVYHSNTDHEDFISSSPYYPSPLSIMSYFATSTIEVTPTIHASKDFHTKQYLKNNLSKLFIPNGVCNKPVYNVQLIHRRRSGRGVSASYTISAPDHSIQYNVPKKATDDDNPEEDEKLLQGLTTFNLTTSQKQKEARDKVDLPFLQAQEVGEGGAGGGAVIYEFEKDDDYDEEDPYEDPF